MYQCLVFLKESEEVARLILPLAGAAAQMVDVAQMLTEFIEVMRSVPQKRVQRADEHFVDGLFLQVVEEIVVVIQTFAHGHISGRNAQQCLSCKHKVLK